ncbi:MAG TPA: hypothetical protein VF067_09130 [Sphingomicrobium sp.]
MNRIVLALIGILLVSACTVRTDTAGPQPQPHPLVDNFFQTPAGGEVSLANLAGGTFRLEDRCLVLMTGDGRRTPIFAAAPGDVVIERERMVVRGLSVSYAQPYVFPGLAPGPTLHLANAECPPESVVVSAIEPRTK